MYNNTKTIKHKKPKNILLNNKKQFSSTIDSMNDAIHIIDRDLKIILFNKRFKEWNQKLGLKTGVLGKNIFKLFPFLPNRIKKEYRKVFSKKIPIITLENNEIGGKKYIVETQKIPIFEKNRVSQVLTIVRDITRYKIAEKSLKDSALKLREQKMALERKNLALKEIIEQIEIEKNKIKDDIKTNVEELLLPILKKLKIKGVSRKYVTLLYHNLQQLTESFGRKITEKHLRLTPREIEICNMIKDGLTSKEVSSLLNLSYQTIEKHRKNIRKKLAISNKAINLTSFLKNI